jgi:hypothetical protein
MYYEGYSADILFKRRTFVSVYCTIVARMPYHDRSIKNLVKERGNCKLCEFMLKFGFVISGSYCSYL